MLKAGTWYVVASVAGQFRTYRVSRVVDATPTTERFDRPDDFDLAAYWAESTAAYERDVPRVDVEVRVRPDRVDRLRDAVGGAAFNAAETLPEPDPEGWLRLRLRLDWPDDAARTLLSAGRWVEVLGPPEIRARVASTARAVAERYATRPQLSPGASGDQASRRSAAATASSSDSPRAGAAISIRSFVVGEPNRPSWNERSSRAATWRAARAFVSARSSR